MSPIHTGFYPHDFYRALDAVLSYEGVYSNDATDPGGATYYGIDTASYHETLSRVPAEIRKNLPQNPADITKPDAERIYFQAFWQYLNCGIFNSGVAFLFFDCAVNPGIGFAPRAFQRALKVTPDGIIGQETIRAARASDPVAVITELSLQRSAHYFANSNLGIYGKGLIARTIKSACIATSLA